MNATTISSTLSMSHAVATQWDVIVIGAGVAGTSVAGLLQKNGMKTLIVDSQAFPRDKVCGGCLNIRAQTFLKREDLLDKVNSSGAVPLDRLQIVIGQHRSTWKIPSLLSVRRSTLDAVLLRRVIDQGAEFLGETYAQVESNKEKQRVTPSLPTKRSRPLVRLTSSTAGKSSHESYLIESKSVVVAAGLSCSPMPRDDRWQSVVEGDSKIGVHCLLDMPSDANRPDSTLSMILNRTGYVGVCETDGNKIDIAAAIDPATIRNPHRICDVVKNLLSSANLDFDLPTTNSLWQTTPFLTRSSSQVAAEGIFLVGDSLGYVEPFTGEGMSWAFASADALASLLIKSQQNKTEAKSEHHWERWVKQRLRHRQSIARWVSRQSRKPELATWILRACDWIPSLRRSLINKATR